MECPIAKWAYLAPERQALYWRGTTLTYRELDQYITRKTTHFTPGIIYPCTTIDCITLFAIFRVQACALLINSRFPEQRKQELIETYKEKKAPKNTVTALLTSGTTSTPKIACHSFENYSTSALLSYKKLGMGTHSRTLILLPLFHVAGIVSLFRTFVAGGYAIFPDTNSIQREIILHRITHLSVVPTQLHPLSDISQRLSILIGGASCPPSLLKRVQHHMLFHSYGMTETTAMVLCNGLPLQDVSSFITKEGRLFIKAPTLFQGYLTNGSLTLPLTEEGYFNTGDRATYNKDLSITLLGRFDRMFISGGENIQPAEIEKILETHPQIKKAIIRPREDPRFGHIPIAYIQPIIDQKEIAQFLSKKLPKYKIPKEVYPISELGGKYAINF